MVGGGAGLGEGRRGGRRRVGVRARVVGRGRWGGGCIEGGGVDLMSGIVADSEEARIRAEPSAGCNEGTGRAQIFAGVALAKAQIVQ